METTRSLRKRVSAPPKPGAPFEIDPALERSERMRLDLPGRGEDNYHFTWWDDIKFSLVLPLCATALIGCVALFLYSWLA